MVRLTESLNYMRPQWGLNKRWRNRRHPFNPDLILPHPVERTPLRCRNKVIPRKSQEDDVVCIKEMLNLFACMKANELNENECPKELAAFQKCYSNYITEWTAKQKIQDPTEPIPGQTKLTSHQVNVMLKRYPQKIDI
ncbi:uncharacterized protein LOC107359656 [Tetranychus urticae]|uniref:Uncharacterized protein n=1 Tax=Tetranychus urticae TaxID=32264 RepID=T1K1E8_TETUR|nr:uncharacterized protein LOC107359656 [Tetranychus urticae]